MAIISNEREIVMMLLQAIHPGWSISNIWMR